MAIVRFKPGPVPVQMSDEDKAFHDAMTPEEIEQNAFDDPDNPPWTDEELARAVAGRTVRQIRAKTGLSQSKFADKFQINPARLRDWEQGRFMPDSVALAYLKVIEHSPKAVEAALGSK
jgi:putative transcriptional regulator